MAFPKNVLESVFLHYLHGSAGFLHLHWRVHCFVHPHRISSLQIFTASGSFVQIGLNWPSDVFSQPHSLGHGSWGCACNIWPNHMDPWYTACWTCCTRVWCVGGIDSKGLPFIANSFLHAVLMSLQVFVQSYIRMTNLAMMLIQDSGISVCSGLTSDNAFVSSGNDSRTIRAVCLPRPANADTVLHPVSA